MTQFIANLRPSTVAALAGDAAGGGAASPRAGAQGFLLSAHRATPAMTELARRTAASGHRLFADNGTTPRITQLRETFGDRAAPLAADFATLTADLGRLPRGNDIPLALRAAASALASEVVDAATDLADAVDEPALLAAQVEMGATDIIAAEDFSVAALLGLGLGRALTGWRTGRVVARSRASLRRWARVAADPSTSGLRVYAVLSAMDHTTARRAGREAAAAGVTHVALGLAGINADRSRTDSHVVGGRIVPLGRMVARRHLRLVEIVHGLTAGFADAGGSLRGLHALGLGSPYLLPLLRAAAGAVPDVTADATSPIHDAVRDGVLYDHDNLGRRQRITALVHQVVAEGRVWACGHTPCDAVMTALGHDPAEARKTWLALGRPELTQADLRQPHPLSAHLPVFWRTPDEAGGAARRAQVAHNHLVLNDVAAAVPTSVAAHRRLDELLVLSRSAATDTALMAAAEVLRTLDGQIVSPRRRAA